MKHNIYDLFSDYEGELPELKEEQCNTEHIKQLVLEGTQKKLPIKHMRPKMFIICVAAAMTAVSGLTVAAATDGFSRFRAILHKTESSVNLSEELPLIKNGSINGMEQNISEKQIVFTGNDIMTISTVGMYYDNNTMMISLEMKLNEDISIPDNAIILPYFSKEKDGVWTKLQKSGLANTSRMTRGDEPNTYYATFYLPEKNINNSTIGITLKNIITVDDAANIQRLIISEQESWRNEYDFSSHTIDEWKQYWKENDFDQRTINKLDEYLSECDNVIDGEWSAEINISDIDNAVIFSREGFTVKADTLSLTFDIDKDLPEYASAVPVVTMKDGTVIYDGGTKEKEFIIENGIINQNIRCIRYANRFANVFSYSEPQPVSDISNISVYVFNINNHGELTTDCFNIYNAEAER